MEGADGIANQREGRLLLRERASDGVDEEFAKIGGRIDQSVWPLRRQCTDESNRRTRLRHAAVAINPIGAACRSHETARRSTSGHLAICADRQLGGSGSLERGPQHKRNSMPQVGGGYARDGLAVADGVLVARWRGTAARAARTERRGQRRARHHFRHHPREKLPVLSTRAPTPRVSQLVLSAICAPGANRELWQACQHILTRESNDCDKASRWCSSTVRPRSSMTREYMRRRSDATLAISTSASSAGGDEAHRTSISGAHR
eukprot:scaffold269680_cov28-Tisochrysis_lutea.AAC.2